MAARTLTVRRGVRVIAGLAVLATIIGCFLMPYGWIVASSFKPQAAIFRDLKPLSWRHIGTRRPDIRQHRPAVP